MLFSVELNSIYFKVSHFLVPKTNQIKVHSRLCFGCDGLIFNLIWRTRFATFRKIASLEELESMNERKLIPSVGLLFMISCGSWGPGLRTTEVA